MDEVKLRVAVIVVANRTLASCSDLFGSAPSTHMIRPAWLSTSQDTNKTTRNRCFLKHSADQLLLARGTRSRVNIGPPRLSCLFQGRRNDLPCKPLGEVLDFFQAKVELMQIPRHPLQEPIKPPQNEPIPPVQDTQVIATVTCDKLFPGADLRGCGRLLNTTTIQRASSPFHFGCGQRPRQVRFVLSSLTRSTRAPDSQTHPSTGSRGP